MRLMYGIPYDTNGSDQRQPESVTDSRFEQPEALPLRKTSEKSAPHDSVRQAKKHEQTEGRQCPVILQVRNELRELFGARTNPPNALSGLMAIVA
jgi:hypothetical protein